MRAITTALCLTCAATAATAADRTLSYSTYGEPGLIDMPTAQSANDADLAATIYAVPGGLRTTLSFQISDRLSGSFRYSRIDNWDGEGTPTFDRSFDLRFRLLNEGKYRPAVTVGVRDFIGTGIYAGEYVVATKHLTPDVTVTAGLGWGRLASYNGFENPLAVLSDRFKTRPGRSRSNRNGGVAEVSRWFRGDAALFGGIAWRATNRMILKLEYSSDAYLQESDISVVDRKSPYNFGIAYQIANGVQGHLSYMHGSDVGFGITLVSNPKTTAANGGAHPYSPPVFRRSAAQISNTSWVSAPNARQTLADALHKQLAPQGIELLSLQVTAHRAEIRVRNTRFDSSAEMIGRTARLATQVLPASVETLQIVPVVRSMAASTVTINRTDLERLEHDPDAAWRSFARAQITPGKRPTSTAIEPVDAMPRLKWGIGPYLRLSYFDPSSPVRYELGAELNAEYRLTDGLYLTGQLQKRIIGTLGRSDHFEPSGLPRVRSDGNSYDREGDPALTQLTLSYFVQPRADLYGRFTVGYLERQYGGASAELLWKPVDSRFALGAEINYVAQRDFNMLFGFRDYKIATGHISGYWDMGNGFHGQLDLGRYLAGDWGGTLTVDREFKNGWKVGAYVTLTDASADDFGEGSFDKGIRLSVPFSTVLGKPTRNRSTSVIKSLSRDGGARVEVPNRLYDLVRDYHQPELRNSWGRFWR